MDWQGMWDGARGVFKDYIDYDSFKFEQNLAEDRLRYERERDQDTAPRTDSWGPVASAPGMDTKTLLIGAAVIGGGLLIAKQFKLI